jgi:uncharacterized protein YdaU (DUF1376 family)
LSAHNFAAGNRIGGQHDAAQHFLSNKAPTEFHFGDKFTRFRVLFRRRIESLMSKTAPAIPLFGDAYLADTRHLSLEEHGAYLQLMMIAWRIDGCCLPDDDARLARMLGIPAAKWRKLKPTIMGFWTLENGNWYQGRLLKERKFVDEKRAKNKASAEARWEGQTPENKQGEECERISEGNAPPPPPPVSTDVETVQDASHPSPRANPFPRPAWADKQTWSDWMAVRKKKRATNSATAYAGFLSDIERLADDEWPPPRLLQFAVSRSWAGIYDPREEGNGRQRQPTESIRGTRPDPALDMWLDVQRERAAFGDPGTGGGSRLALPPPQPG